uniref:Uncharacterized protein n=1 Tax=candidate division WOR-3 bacterium TaxID=2052148 RepID=A0A7V3UZG2_UNCW3
MITSLFPYQDRHHRLHIFVSLIPSVHDTRYIIPLKFWHWFPENSPPWSRIHRAGCQPEN